MDHRWCHLTERGRKKSCLKITAQRNAPALRHLMLCHVKEAIWTLLCCVSQLVISQLNVNAAPRLPLDCFPAHGDHTTVPIVDFFILFMTEPAWSGEAFQSLSVCFFMLYQAFPCLFWPEPGAGPSAEACIFSVPDGAVHSLLVDQLQRDPLRSSVSLTKISLWCLLLQGLGRSFNPSSVQSVPNSLFSPGLFIAVPFRGIQPSRQANWIFPKFPWQTELSLLSCCQSAIIYCVMEHEAEAHLI